MRSRFRRDTPVTTDVIRSIDHDLEPIFDADGTTTALTFAPAADGVVALVLGHTGEALGEVAITTSCAGSPLDVVSVRPDHDVDRLDFRSDLSVDGVVSARTRRVRPGVGRH